MSTTRLGIDIGTNSLGWVLYDLNGNGQICDIRRAGVRIFSHGREDKSNASKNQKRREARQARRQRDRYLQRRTAVLNYLEKFGLMPEDRKERRNLQDVDPYFIRAKAMSEKIPLHHLGRAIFHISQKRGFKSNRRTDKQSDGPVSESIAEFTKQLDNQTVGQFLSSLHEKRQPVRSRRRGNKTKDTYFYYPDRSLIESEFNALWDKQQQFYPQELTEKNKETLHEIIFKQRNLKPPIIGKCHFYPYENRIAKALSSFQRYRILCDINNLAYYDETGERSPLSDNMRAWTLKNLFAGDDLSFNKIRKRMKEQKEIDLDVIFNLEDKKRPALKGDITAKNMRNCVAGKWNTWSMEDKDKVVSLLLDDGKNDEAVHEALIKEWNLPKDEACKCIKVDLDNKQENNGRGSLSAKAIAALMPYLEKGKRYDQAVDEAQLEKLPSQTPDNLLSKLPKYSKVLGQWCMPRTAADENNHELWRIPNPTVHIALNQLRRVVNEIIRKDGKPLQIVVELARDLPRGQKTKSAIKEQQTENQKTREKHRTQLGELKISPSPDALLRMLLWEQSSENANHRCCVYCGKTISCCMATSADCEIDHILPFSRTLDDGVMNKVLCCQNCNRTKGKQTPDETWASDKEGYQGILARVKHFPESKRQRFQHNALKIYLEKHEGDFLARQLTDTQYIAKATKLYLEKIMPSASVYVIPGRLTSILRWKWGLNNILGNGKKNRADHRHHAIDAAVVGATTRSTLQQFANEAAKDNANLSKLNIDEPMENFRSIVEKSISYIIVSHKTRRHIEGALHDETAYGLPKDFKENSGPQPVTHHIGWDKLSIKLADNLAKPPSANEKLADKIVDLDLREKLTAFCEYHTKKILLKEQLQKYGEEENIRRVLLKENESVVPIYQNDTPYKGYLPNNNWAYDIFEETADGKWSGEIISTFNINKKNYAPAWKKQFLQARLLMRLHINDSLTAMEGEKQVIYRVQKLTAGQITLMRHCDAVKTAKTVSPKRLQDINGRKIHISPTGLITYPHNS